MHNHAGDDELLGIFRQLGVDATKPREILFYFYFPGEAQADSAAAMLKADRYDAHVTRLDPPWWKRLFAKPSFGVMVNHTMPLDEARIKNMTTRFQQIAAKNNGEYDGWEANVADDDISAEQLEGLK